MSSVLRFTPRVAPGTSRFGLAASLLLFGLLGLEGPFVQAQEATIQTVLNNGPVSNRLNVVFLSEGYPSNQLAGFLVDATNAINALLTHEPYTEYRSYLNAFAISVASLESGSDHPASHIQKDTYFNSAYDAVLDRLITIPPNAQDPNPSHGQGKVDTLVQTFMPQCDLPVLLVNEPFYNGGSDGFDKTAIASVAPALSDILNHETGHVLANLGDEYTTSHPGFPNTEEPNTTRQTQRDLIKWRAWISDSTPVPTPATFQYADAVGLFQGAHYHTSGWYRPKLDCAMRSLSAPFCEVCREAMVLAIYGKVRPVDGFVPANTNVTITTPQSVAFSIDVLKPATHDLVIQWLTNGAPVLGATAQSFSVSPASLVSGSNQLSAQVQDRTPFVRNDPANQLSQTITWNLNVDVTQLQLDSPLLLEGGQVAFRILGGVNETFILQESTDFLNWNSIQTNHLIGGSFGTPTPLPKLATPIFSEP